MVEIDFSRIEKKWQDKWEKAKCFSVKEDKKKKKYYVVEMYPYPSGSGLHIGHAFNYTIGDICARFKIMQGFNVLHPMGFDSFGLPAENAAIKSKSHPKNFTEEAIAMFIKQQKALGLTYDWNRMIMSHSPEYYKWDQWIFLKMFEKGLAYKKKASVNWCPDCNTVLANEQVQNGFCWRHHETPVEIKYLEQWFFKITDYADELYDNVDKLVNWPERIRAMQKNWIGKSYGTEIDFEINGEKWPIFTTRPDTIYGVTFMVVSAQHPRLMELVTSGQKKEVEKFLKKIKSTSEKVMKGSDKSEGDEELEKEGAFTGSYAINPLTNEKIPVYTGNFVIADYGAGMVMAVPAHDERDFQFAKKYNIQIRVVINPDSYDLNPEKMSRAYVGEGRLVNSGEFNKWNNKEAIDAITEFLAKKKLGKKTVNYKLRDWLISRQRFWGTPIPIIYCDKCGAVAVAEKDLPVVLPEKIKFESSKNPLLGDKKFINVKCPKCGKLGRRETDTMDTFVNSSWYFFRYCDSKNKKQIFDPKKAEYWMPMDQYIGGAEHACMHLIYSRFYTRFLRDLGLTKLSEPTLNLFNQGMVHGSDGVVMSKSRGNVVDPLDMIKKYSCDTLRIFLVSIAAPDSDSMWSDTGIESMHKFVRKFVDFYSVVKIGKSSARIESKVNKAIREVTDDIEKFRYNMAVIKLRGLLDIFSSEEKIGKKDLESYLKMISVFCPHVAEELWAKIGGKGFISLEKWPVCDEKKIDMKLEQLEQAVEKTVGDIQNVLKIIKEKQGKDGEKIYLYVMPFEISGYNEESLSKRFQKQVKVFAVNDKNKYDPEAKSSKAKPGKPGIFVE